ncbi:MAG TPA: chemotaxis protein CheA, partial [Aquifex aeolicus]|nr:chemotaxis protein CheA [Aquifex aeolicus]
MLGDEMREIFNEFVVEAEENLQKIEESLLELEKSPKDEELLNATFRAMHTLKGGAGFLGLKAIVETAHAAEDVLGKLRSGELEFSPTINDAILEAVDFIRSALQRYEADEDVEIPEDLVQKLRAIEKGAQREKDEEKPTVSALLEKYGFAHLKDKPIEDILEELILLPPDERPTELIEELDKIIMTRPKVNEEEKEKRPPIKTEGEKVLRIDVSKIENLMNLVGELVLERNRLLRVSQKLYDEYQSKTVDELESVMSSLDRIVGDLQLAVMKTRMQPVKRLFQKFPRVVRDLARMLGKDVELVLEGEDAEMDKTVLEKLEEPLIHLIRNAVDHGIEMPDDRERAGKP